MSNGEKGVQILRKFVQFINLKTNKMRTGRPRERAITLMDGFYIEISNAGDTKGVKIRSESKAAMENAAKQYSRYKEVTILGEYKNGVRLTKETA